MIVSKLELIDDQTSPLFRVISVHNFANPAGSRQFGNNVCGFHIGRGLVLSVAHNLRGDAGNFFAINQLEYANDILPRLQRQDILTLERYFPLDVTGNIRNAVNLNDKDKKAIAKILRTAQYDTRWHNFYNGNFCKPALLIQFKSSHFFNDPALTALFNPANYFFEPGINRYSFLIELELIQTFYEEDLALYRIVNTPQAIINRIPSIEPSFRLLDDDTSHFYCLQSSPNSEVGKMINKAQIEGVINYFNIQLDLIGGDYLFEGNRYLIKGYFKFGSSGAPYILYDEESRRFKVNAVQSAAAPIQLMINNSQNGNLQYINAIASPLNLVEERFREYLA